MSNNIRHYREERGLSIRALADKLGVHFTTIGKMERETLTRGVQSWPASFHASR